MKIEMSKVKNNSICYLLYLINVKEICRKHNAVNLCQVTIVALYIIIKYRSSYGFISKLL